MPAHLVSNVKQRLNTEVLEEEEEEEEEDDEVEVDGEGVAEEFPGDDDRQGDDDDKQSHIKTRVSEGGSGEAQGDRHAAVPATLIVSLAVRGEALMYGKAIEWLLCEKSDSSHYFRLIHIYYFCMTEPTWIYFPAPISLDGRSLPIVPSSTGKCASYTSFRPPPVSTSLQNGSYLRTLNCYIQTPNCYIQTPESKLSQLLHRNSTSKLPTIIGTYSILCSISQHLRVSRYLTWLSLIR